VARPATSSAALGLPTVGPATFRRLAYLAVAALFVIVVSGATVRLTASGLGCENWPRCGDAYLPEKDFHALVEFGNRVVGLVVGAITLLTALAAWRVTGLQRWVRWGAVALPITVLLQGVLGGVTVLLELHPVTVMAHFLLSQVALAVAVAVALGARASPAVAGVRARTAWPAFVLLPSTLALVVTGAFVTAAGPHSGGDDIERMGELVNVLHVHMGATAVFGVSFVGLLGALVAQGREARAEQALAAGILALVLTQMAVGGLQWKQELPWELVPVHVALATAIWVGVTALAARVFLRPAQP
jgi:cytochrome c oxidase assembly protein subunit 15